MSHIISHSKEFWFIHNPKVGGSTLRSQIGNLDETGKKFFHHEVNHPVLGHIFMGHLTPKVMREHFSADFEKIRDYATFAFMRDPMERFRSAYAQRSKQFTGAKLVEQTSEIRTAGIEDALRYLEQNKESDCFEASYCHFQPQASFMELDGARFVKHLYRLDGMARALGDIQTHLGIELEMRQRNKSYGISENKAPELHSDALRSFVEDYYARDYALYHALSAQPATSSAATV